MEVSRRTLLGGMLAGGAATAAACSSAPANTAVAPTGAATADPPPPTGGATPAPPSPSAPAPTGPAVEVSRGPADRPAVALTFHASGDPALVEPLLSAAERGGAKITVFAVGSWLAQNPTVAARAQRGGHELANHTWSHPDLSVLGAAQLDAEVVRCRDELAKLGGTPGTYFRPSQTANASPAMLAAAGRAGYRTSLAYDVDPEDFRDPGSALVRDRVLRDAKAGSIVSLHFGHQGTVAALPEILTGLSAKGLRAVTASELLKGVA